MTADLPTTWLTQGFGRDESGSEAREVQLEFLWEMRFRRGLECRLTRARVHAWCCQLAHDLRRSSRVKENDIGCVSPDLRPGLELGGGFSGIAGCTPSTASQWAFHLTPALAATPAGSGFLRNVAKSISSSGRWYSWGWRSDAPGLEVELGGLRGVKAGIGSGRGGMRIG